MKNVILSNETDQYLVDPDKAATVKAWLRAVKNGDDPLNSFCDFFPNDPKVIDYLNNPTDLRNERTLQFHIEVIQSGIPIKEYFDIHGITDNKIVSTLRELLDDPEPEVRIKALKLVRSFKNPQTKPIRVGPTQINNFNLDQDSKNEIVEKILEKVNAVNERTTSDA